MTESFQPKIKYCSDCGKSEGGFFRDRGRSDGLSRRCKKCDQKRRYARKRKNWVSRRKFQAHVAAWKAFRRAQKSNERAKARYAKLMADAPQKLRDAAKARRQKDPAYFAAKTAKRAATQKQAMPKWANMFFISEAYDLATRRSKSTGIRWEVDHIVPIRSKLVCGLHCEQNLQVIPGKENCQKSNLAWPDMPSNVPMIG